MDFLPQSSRGYSTQKTTAKKTRIFTHFSRHVFDHVFHMISPTFHAPSTHVSLHVFTTPSHYDFHTVLVSSRVLPRALWVLKHYLRVCHFLQISKTAGKWPKRAPTELSLRPKGAQKHDESKGGHESPPGAPQKSKNPPARPNTKSQKSCKIPSADGSA